jgi:hypothetical protein
LHPPSLRRREAGKFNKRTIRRKVAGKFAIRYAAGFPLMPLGRFVSTPEPTMTRDVPRTLDLRPSANIFQASLILVVSPIGAIVGFQMVANGRWIAAAGGGIVGMIVATFISGFVLMFRPQSIPQIDALASINKYRRIRRWYTTCAVFFVCWVVVAVGWLFCALPLAAWSIATWSVPMLACYVLLQYHRHVLDLWRCPNCGELFGRYGAFTRLPHHCPTCVFTVDRDSTVAE